MALKWCYAEIARKNRRRIAASNLDVDILPADKVKDLAEYRAVIVGSATYIGKWRKEVVAFIENNEKTLTGMPVWFFSSGPTGEGDPVDLMKGFRSPEALQPVLDRIQPRDIAVFHGRLDPSKLGFTEKLLIKGIKAPLGDFRNWDVISAWAASIGEELSQEA